MNRSDENELNRILEEWADENVASASALDALKRKVDDRLAAYVPALVDVKPLQRPPSRRWLVASILATAAVLLVAVGLWRRGGGDGTEGNGLKPLSSAIAQDPHPLPDDAVSINHEERLLEEYQAVFGRDLTWVVERGGRADVGLIRSTDTADAAHAEQFVAIRLVLWSRSTGGGSWKQLQDFNVLAGREELVQIPSPADGIASLTLWAYPLDEKMISIDLRYEPSEFASQANVPRDVVIESSSVQRFGESAPVVTFEREGVEYRLHQSAVLLTENGVG